MLIRHIVSGNSDEAVKIIDSGVLGQGAKKKFYGHCLYLAARTNDTNVMLALLAKGANVNHKEPLGMTSVEIGQTPLHAAAQSRSAQALRILLDHGSIVSAQDRAKVTPLALSVLSIEAPGPVTDMLIEAGVDLRVEKKVKGYSWVDLYASRAGIHWAMASYSERHGDKTAAVGYYRTAAEWYQKAAENLIGWAKFQKFMSSPFMRSTLVVGSLATGAAAQSSGGVVVYGGNAGPFTPLDPNLVNTAKSNISALQDKAERYAAYSKLCSDLAVVLSANLNP